MSLILRLFSVISGHSLCRRVLLLYWDAAYVFYSPRFCLVLWHINIWGLFNAKSCLYIHLYNMVCVSYWPRPSCQKKKCTCVNNRCIRSKISGDNLDCPWCSRYRRRKWTRRHEFKSWTRLIAFHIALIPLGKVWIQLFSLQLWVNSRTD